MRALFAISNKQPAAPPKNPFVAEVAQRCRTRYAADMESYLPTPNPAALAEAVVTLRRDLDFRRHVATTEGDYINAAILMENGKIQIHVVDIVVLRDYLRVIEAEEAARAAVAEALRPSTPDELPLLQPVGEPSPG